MVQGAFSVPVIYQFWRKDSCFAINLSFCSLDIWLVSGRLNSIVHIILYAVCGWYEPVCSAGWSRLGQEFSAKTVAHWSKSASNSLLSAAAKIFSNILLCLLLLMIYMSKIFLFF